MFSNLFAVLYKMYERWGEPDPFFRVSLTFGGICAFTLQLLIAVVSKHFGWELLNSPIEWTVFLLLFVALVAWGCYRKKSVIMKQVKAVNYNSTTLNLALALLLLFT